MWILSALTNSEAGGAVVITDSPQLSSQQRRPCGVWCSVQANGLFILGNPASRYLERFVTRILG